MKRSIFAQVVALVNGEAVADMDTLRQEVNEEWARVNEKAEENRNIYESARQVAFSILSETPKTVAEVFTEGEGKWPDGFTASKVQYAFLHYWNDAIKKHDNGKKPYTYSV